MAYSRSIKLGGICAVGIGVLCILSEIFPSLPHVRKEYVPSWVAAAVGLTLVTAGVYLLAPDTPRIQWLKDTLALSFCSIMGIVSMWVAFGPGKRPFASNIPVLNDELSGRIGCGISGLLLIAITYVGWRNTVLKWKSERYMRKRGRTHSFRRRPKGSA